VRGKQVAVDIEALPKLEERLTILKSEDKILVVHTVVLEKKGSA